MKDRRLESVENFKYLESVIFNPALQLHSGFCCEPPRSSYGLCMNCSEVSYRISSQGLGSFFRVLLSRSSSQMDKTSVRISLTVESSEMFLSLHMIFNLERAAVVWASLKRILSGEETETQMVWPHLKILWHGEYNSTRDSKRRMIGRQKKRWEDNIKELTGMEFGDSLKAVEDRARWNGIVATSSAAPRRKSRLRD